MHNSDWTKRKDGFLVFFLAAVAVAFPLWGEGDLQLKDRILAVVDEDPILASDVERMVALGLVQPKTDEEGNRVEGDNDFRHRILEELIEQRLRFHAVERLGFEQASDLAVDEQLEATRSRFESAEEMERQLAEVGLDQGSLRQLFLRQLLVITYVEERLGPRIFIRPEELQTYYRDVLIPELETRSVEVPSFQEVREQIRRVLREQRLNAEIAAWTQELRDQAEVQLYLDPLENLPPVVDRIQ